MLATRPPTAEICRFGSASDFQVEGENLSRDSRETRNHTSLGGTSLFHP